MVEGHYSYSLSCVLKVEVAKGIVEEAPGSNLDHAPKHVASRFGPPSTLGEEQGPSDFFAGAYAFCFARPEKPHEESHLGGSVSNFET